MKSTFGKQLIKNQLKIIQHDFESVEKKCTLSFNFTNLLTKG